MKVIFENFLNEYRNKDVYSIIRPIFKDTPEYVFKELYYSYKGFFKSEFIKLVNDEADIDDIENIFSDFIDLKWKKKVVEVNFNDFDEDTQIFMMEREMGKLNIDTIPNDEARHNLQKNIVIRNYGNNEPVIMTKTSEGYHLYEGWHRTMAILSLGSDNTDNYGDWKKVKLNAWIGV